MMAMKRYSTFSKAPIITGTSPSDCLISYPGHSLEGRGEVFPLSSKAVYSTAPADWATKSQGITLIVCLYLHFWYSCLRVGFFFAHHPIK